MAGRNPGAGPGTSSYALLTALLAYAPTATEQALIATQYNDLQIQLGGDTRKLDAALADAIVRGCIDNEWPWTERKPWHDKGLLNHGAKVMKDSPDPRTEVIQAEASLARRRSVKRHIEQALAELPVGAKVLVADITKFKSDEYGDDSPSPGAIAAMLFDRDNAPRDLGNGIVGCLIKGKKGAQKKG